MPYGIAKAENGVEIADNEDGTVTVFAWEIPWTEEPGGPQSTGLPKCWTRLSN